MFHELTQKYTTKKVVILSAFAALSVIISVLAIIFLSSDNTKAAVMRLEKYIGTVLLTDNGNNNLELLEGMRLTSGSSLATMQESFAYISLDDTKSVKLDAFSSCNFIKEGDLIQLNLNEGKLIFNVTEKLQEGELLEIETSTMVSSIRGTSGYVEVIDEYSSSLALLTGEVAVTILNENSEIDQVVRIYAGQKITINTKANIGEENYIVEDLLAEDVPQFVQEAIEEDDALSNELDTKEPDFNDSLNNLTDLPVDDDDLDDDATEEENTVDDDYNSNVDIDTNDNNDNDNDDDDDDNNNVEENSDAEHNNDVDEGNDENNDEED